MKPQSIKAKSPRMAILERAVLAEEIEVSANGWGLNTMVGSQGEWISNTIIDEWLEQELIEVHGETGTITAKGKRLDYKEDGRKRQHGENEEKTDEQS